MLCEIEPSLAHLFVRVRKSWLQLTVRPSALLFVLVWLSPTFPSYYYSPNVQPGLRFSSPGARVHAGTDVSDYLSTSAFHKYPQNLHEELDSAPHFGLRFSRFS